MLELDIRLQYPCPSPAKRARRCRTMTRQATGPSHWPRRRKLREPNSCRLIQIHCHLVSCLVDESRARNASRATSRSIIGPAPPLFFFSFSSSLIRPALPPLRADLGFWMAIVVGQRRLGCHLRCGRLCACASLGGWCGMDGLQKAHQT
ncbi:hypothetical protein LI328DRAFT_117643 [Trichoderma asperelloides]|nr:hypothetical protein LI328DRAFT_117643 [Trichoderma asperelloides]